MAIVCSELVIKHQDEEFSLGVIVYVKLELRNR